MAITTKKSADEIRQELKQFYGTEQYYNLMFGFKCTDGVKAMADLCGAYWFLDIVISYQMYNKFKQNRSFQVWKLAKNKTNDGWKVTATDGNENKLGAQRIPYSDFPLDEGMTVWLINGVIILPREY